MRLSLVFGAAAMCAASPGFTLVTINMARSADAPEIVREFRAAPRLRDADVVVMQEVRHPDAAPLCVAAQVAEALGMQVAYSPAATGITDQGVAILSRYPMRDVRTRVLPRHDLVFHSRSKIAISATVETPGGPVRVSNAHLDTRVNPGERIAQLRPVLDDSRGFAGAHIIAGDFNTGNFYYLGHVLPLPVPGLQTGAVQTLLAKAGYTNPVAPSEATFDHLGMHLDWVFSDRLRASEAQVIPLDFSDHHAVWVRYR